MSSRGCYSTIATRADESLLGIDTAGAVIACAGKGRTLYLFDVASEEPLRRLEQHHGDWIHSVALDAGAERVFSCGRDKVLSCCFFPHVCVFIL
jgi:hypothetical protein